MSLLIEFEIRRLGCFLTLFAFAVVGGWRRWKFFEWFVRYLGFGNCRIAVNLLQFGANEDHYELSHFD
jgi:hypothetical protein